MEPDLEEGGYPLNIITDIDFYTIKASTLKKIKMFNNSHTNHIRCLALSQKTKVKSKICFFYPFRK